MRRRDAGCGSAPRRSTMAARWDAAGGGLERWCRQGQPAATRGHPRRRCGGLFAADGAGRGGHDGGARCCACRLPLGDRTASRPRHRHGRRFRARRVRDRHRRRQRGACRAEAARRSRRRRAGGQAHALSHRGAPGRRDREERRQRLRRWGERRGPAAGAGAARGVGGVRRRTGGRRASRRSTLRGPGRATGEEYRPSATRLSRRADGRRLGWAGAPIDFGTAANALDRRGARCGGRRRRRDRCGMAVAAQVRRSGNRRRSVGGRLAVRSRSRSRGRNAGRRRHTRADDGARAVASRPGGGKRSSGPRAGR